MSHPSHRAAALLSRRSLLRVGGLGSLATGLSVSGTDATSSSSSSSSSPQPVDSCILLFYYGVPSHLDTWDLKPHAPAEIRGQFRPIGTRVPGLYISEHLPHCARITDKLAIVRSLHHPMRNHNSAAVEALCG